MTDKVTVFSNGVADFRRVYDVADQPAEISIPVNKAHIGDVLASLTISGGGITIARPPSYRPANDTRGTLELAPRDVIVSLATRLSGARVAVLQAGDDRTLGTLVGLDTVRERTASGDIEVSYVVVLTPEAGLQRFDVAHILGLQFLDADVQAEIDKALKRNFETIKPDSTFVDITLTAAEPAQAVIGYTIPAAAWKMSYRLRTDGEGAMQFQGNAIVDNNTQEHWNDVDIAVVTGEPLTFSTDLAEAKVPRRSHVDIVKATAAGAVEVDEGVDAMHLMAAPAAAGAPPALPSPGAAPSRSAGRRRASRGPEGVMEQASDVSAAFDVADVSDVGDFSLFRSPVPVTIDANRSAVIPMFALDLHEARVVLHYRYGTNAQRPHRSIAFTNESDFALTRGPCTVYERGTFQGACIVPATKPGGQALLPHAIETGVRVQAEWKDRRNKLARLRIAAGWYVSSSEQRQVVIYTVHNTVDRVYAMVLDHVTALDGEVTAALTVGSGAEPVPVDVDKVLRDGVRFAFDLPANVTAQVVVTETQMVEQQLQITDLGFWRYVEQAIAVDEHLMGAALREVVELKQALDDMVAERTQLQHESEVLQHKQVRLRENIAAGGTHAAADRWRAELAEAESRITRIESESLPQMDRAIAGRETAVERALGAVAAEWTA